MLSSKDQKVYREGIQEIYETLGYYCYFHPLEKEQYTINIYNEREDFMWQLFGIKTIEQDNIDYWED